MTQNLLAPLNEKGRRKTLIAIIIITFVLLSSIGVYFLIQSYRSMPSQSPYIAEYNVINQYSTPQTITVDSQGNVWFILLNESDLAVLYSSNSTIHIFHIPVPTPYSFQTWGIAVDNSRHLVWFGDDTDDFIWSFNIQSDQFKSYNLTTSSFSFPQQLVVDPSGNVWFTELTAQSIGEITTAGQILQYPLPAKLASAPYAGPVGLTMEKNGTIWFTDTLASSIGSLTVYSNNNYTFRVYNMTGKVTEPVGIAMDQQGNVWMTEHGPSLVAEFNPSTGYFRAITTHIPPAPLYTSLPYFVYIDSYGNVWFNEHQGNAIGRFSPSNNSMVEYLIPTRIASVGDFAGAITMALAPNGTPWFTEWFAGKIGTVHLGVPLNVGLAIQNSSVNSGSAVPLSSSASIRLGLSIESNQSSTHLSLAVYLSNPEISNHTAGYNYTFSPLMGNGNFTSLLDMQDQGLAIGTYFFTVSLVTSDIIVSKVIQVNVS